MKKLILTLIVLGSALFLVSCESGKHIQTQLYLFTSGFRLKRYALRKADLPSGWDWRKSRSLRGTGINSDDSSIYSSSYVVFPPDDSPPGLSLADPIEIENWVIMYLSEDGARRAYLEEDPGFSSVEEIIFDGNKLFQPVTSFSPMNSNDEYRYECGGPAPDHLLMVCIYRQRHKNLINTVKIYLNTGHKNNLSLKEINDILGSLDRRLNEVAIDKQSENRKAP